MNYLTIILSLVLAGSAQAQTCRTSITPDTPENRFILNNNGTAFDKKTGLNWMRCALGQTWDSTAKTCHGSPAVYNWQSALRAAETASFAGFKDWRLPNIKELTSIVEGRCFNPAINLKVFPNTIRISFWSASPCARCYPSSTWIVDFYSGGDWYNFRNDSHDAVRLVRGRQ